MKPNFFNNSELMLLRKDGTTVRAIDALQDIDYVFVYFSAHWCPPCRAFTPVLKKFYDAHHATKNFEIIFLSSDKSSDEMMRYFREAHGDYYCLPYADAKSMSRVWSDTYRFRSIPTLLLFENSNPRKIITRCGRDMVTQDPSAETFPWPNADALQLAKPSVFTYIRNTVVVLAIVFVLYSLTSRSK
ncbi:hypothetical protein JKF63_03927 [Porcisia hertigi]|uniref:Thioredoxin domain-containing protein n=1 Tax=Porcisia hertigi TaxID=2761500 RepID=A0A836L5A1_9TRYP|nr:hypothetical protein JKF63_03927 [Porcisia hertigi]